MSKTSIQERLKIIIKTHGLSAASFADKVGVQRSSISHIMTGRNKPSLDFIQKTLAAFPRVNGDWLVTGRKLEENSPANKNEAVEEVKNEPKSSEKEDKVPINNKRKIDKVVLFYDDGTYEITYPNGGG